MIHPLLRIATVAGLHALSDRPDLNADQVETLGRFENNELGALHSLINEVAAHRHLMPAEGPAALAATGTVGSPHPFITWLMGGGAVWLYSIAQIIAAILGWKLPPLPPIPVPPPLPS